MLTLTVSVPGLFTIAPIDRDEARFAQASRQMFEAAALAPKDRDPRLHSGGLVVPMLADRPRLNKPPLTYWLQAGAAAMFTAGDPAQDAIWMYRVPGILALIATVLTTWRLGTRMLDARAGFLAGALVGVTPLIVVDAHQARADLVLLAFTTATMYWLFRAWDSRGVERRHAAAFWVCLAGAILAKGPIAPIVVGLACVGLSAARREARWLLRLRPMIGVVILAALIAPWVVAVGEHVGWQTYIDAISDETLGRVRSAREGHWGPPGYHFILMIGLFWPGSLLIGRGLWLAWTRRAEPSPAFLLAWIVPAWLVFEAIPSKLPHYTMPMYPALALLTAWCLTRDPPSRPPRLAIAGWALVALAPALAMAWFVTIDVRAGGARVGSALAVLALSGSAATTIAAAVAAWRGNFGLSQGRAIAAAVLLLAPALQHVAPRALPGFGTPRLGSAIHAAIASEQADVASTYHEDSLVFAMRGRVARINESEVEGWLIEHPRGIVVVRADHPLAGTGMILGVLRTDPLHPDEPSHVAVRAGATP